MRITALLLLTGSSLLYFDGQAQAQIQSMDYTAKPTTMRAPDSQNAKSRLYVTPKAPASEELAADDPLGLATRDLDEADKKEMDRVFELYKTLSAQQKADAAAQPMKTEPVRRESGQGTMRTLKPSQNESPQASPGSFASIIERYQSKKASGTPTKSLNITDPEKFERSGLPSGESETELSSPAYNQ